MATTTLLTQKKLRAELSDRLKLEDPEYYLEPTGKKISGNVVSDTFAGMDDLERQKRIWKALDDAFGEKSVQFVGNLFAYTRAEWYVTLEDN